MNKNEASHEFPVHVRAQMRLVLDDQYVQAELSRILRLVIGEKVSAERTTKLAIAIMTGVMAHQAKSVPEQLGAWVTRIARSEIPSLSLLQCDEIGRLFKLMRGIPGEIVMQRLKLIADGKDPGPIGRFEALPVERQENQRAVNLNASNATSCYLLCNSQSTIKMQAQLLNMIFKACIESGMNFGFSVGWADIDNTRILVGKSITDSQASQMSKILDELVSKNEIEMVPELETLIGFIRQGAFTIGS